MPDHAIGGKPCTSCGQDVWFAVTKNDKVMPVQPSEDGNLAVVNDVAAGILRVRVLTKASPDLLAGEVRAVSHFVTCPNADKHRRR